MKRIKTDICIVGTGFSGTFAAGELLGTPARIALVEKGAYLSRDRIERNYLRWLELLNAAPGSYEDLFKFTRFIYDDVEFDLYSHVNSGTDAFTYSGHHAAGGNSLLWYGNALRKVPDDFRTRTRFGFGVDWPISYNDLEDYYYRAEVEMGVSGPPADALSPHRKKPFPLPPFPLSPGAIELNRIFRGSGFEVSPSHKARLPIDTAERAACCGAGTCWLFCPADARYNCLTTHLGKLLQSKQVALLEKLTVSRLIQKGDRIVEAVAFDREGRETRIEAEIFVLAANAVENARMLLLSQYHQVDTGFKTRSRAVGKYLADQVGMWVPLALPRNLYGGYEKTVQSCHSLSFYENNARDQHSSAIVEVFFEVPFANADVPKKLLMDTMRQGYFGDDLRSKVMLESLGKVRLCLELEMMAEERNCVALHQSQKDARGDPVAEFHFSIWDQPYLKRSVEYYGKLFTEMAEKTGGIPGTITLRNSFDHMLGTCRMGTDPYDSVVDENLKSHDHSNLYIAGGSSFPTAGVTNPTLTIAALALRCGSHIRSLTG
jgi:choline dehydrogenase-like flavoprotein